MFELDPESEWFGIGFLPFIKRVFFVENYKYTRMYI